MHRPRNVCPQCGKNVIHLQEHIRGTHGEKLLKCELCDKSFSSANRLSKHKLVHANVYKYECETCRKKYKTKFSLSVHQRSHADVKPFQCLVCSKGFVTKRCRDDHMKNHR
ncbi:unnamed protein product [Acanthoscelides obtectus]|uniref:C2H2-type domain-containing protein n=1 Tax=Acanthoscelides obtectus TaxID=200917 RepID=A0A9P0PRG8_ACAOB|nr:unnamed protein product [Acanthoscelides obtectus]CAK1675667.1 hypothetical protein AOBTE_LOCUS30359 [Acanthoscelides obtectus]